MSKDPTPYMKDLGDGKFSTYCHVGVITPFTDEAEQRQGRYMCDKYKLDSYEIPFQVAGAGTVFLFIGPEKSIRQLVKHSIR